MHQAKAPSIQDGSNLIKTEHPLTRTQLNLEDTDFFSCFKKTHYYRGNPMKQNIAHIALVVNDYDEAIDFYTSKLNFNLIEDTILTDTKRWVLVAPKGSTGSCLLLAKASNEKQKSKVGNQTGGRVFLFLKTDNFQRDYQNLLDKGVSIVRKPVKKCWGTVAVFADLYGNLWDLVEPT